MADYLALLVDIANASGGGVVEPGVTVTDCDDFEDNRILECALACGAVMIVSDGDDLLRLSPWRGCVIVTAAHFVGRTGHSTCPKALTTLEALRPAIVIANDSDLRFPTRLARQQVAVGVVNPSTNGLTGDLAGRPGDGIGRHWWYRLDANDIRSYQLAGTAGNYRRPPSW